MNAKIVKQIQNLWPAQGPWNIVHAAFAMLRSGCVPKPSDMSPSQSKIFETTHELMVRSYLEIQEAVLPVGLDPEMWRLLMRGGVCERLVSAPGESQTIKVINAMRGERKVWPGRRREKLWEQLSYPAGMADATLVLIRRLDDPTLEPYRLALLTLIPQLRRCRKLTQERRSAS